MKKNIAVIFGGRSAEHDISIITAHIPIINSLITINDFNVWPIYISKTGSWYCDQKMNSLDFFKQDNFTEKLLPNKKISCSFDNGLQIIWPGFFKKSIKIDIVFPALHGTFGEDGSLMGLLRMANIPFVGCDLFASAVAMDKVLTKQILQVENIPIVPYVWFTRDDWDSKKKILKDNIAKLKWPLFVKPVHLGSSIAITKVKKQEELDNAIEVALHYDDKVLVEESVEKLIEVTLPILGNTKLQLGVIERPLNKTELFDFQDKYLSGGKNGGVNSQYSEMPANISEEFAVRVKDFGTKTYLILGCEGVARIDFLINSLDQKVYVNEVNTLPGSLYAHNWKKQGISNVELVKKLISLAEERFEKNKNMTYIFNSDVLKNVGGQKNNQS